MVFKGVAAAVRSALELLQILLVSALEDYYMGISLFTFSLLINEDFWVFLSFLSSRGVFIPSDKCAENMRSLGKESKSQKSSLISQKNVNKVAGEVETSRKLSVNKIWVSRHPGDGEGKRGFEDFQENFHNFPPNVPPLFVGWGLTTQISWT